MESNLQTFELCRAAGRIHCSNTAAAEWPCCVTLIIMVSLQFRWILKDFRKLISKLQFFKKINPLKFKDFPLWLSINPASNENQASKSCGKPPRAFLTRFSVYPTSPDRSEPTSGQLAFSYRPPCITAFCEPKKMETVK